MAHAAAGRAGRWRGGYVLVVLAVAAASLMLPSAAAANHGTTTQLPADERRALLEELRRDPRTARLIDGVERRADVRLEVSPSPSGRNIALDWYVGDRSALELYVRGSDHAIEHAVLYDIDTQRWRAFDFLTRWLPAIVLSSLVALVLLNWRRLWSLHSVDALALAITGLVLPLWRPVLTTHEMVPPRDLGPGALVLTLPLAWFALRCAAWSTGRVSMPGPGRDSGTAGVKGTGGAVGHAGSPIEIVMWVVAAAALLARWVGNVVSRTMFDVSEAGFLGGQALLDGALPYGDARFTIDPGGDTYGPPAYVAYMPIAWAQRALDVDWELGVVMTTIAIDALATVLLALLVWQLVSRAAAARAVLVWSVHPVVIASVLGNPNDGLVAIGALGALLALRRPFVRGLLIAIAAWVKFAPVVAAGVLVRHGPGRGDPLRFAAGVLLVTAACIASFALYDGGAHRFWAATFGFQLHRDDDSSVWGAYAMREALPYVQAIVVLALAWLALTALRARLALQRCAGLACAMAIVQLPLQHLGVPYLVWVLPGLLPVLVAGHGRQPASGPDEKHAPTDTSMDAGRRALE